MRILVADDHGIVRSGIKLLLERQADLQVVAEASDGVEAVEKMLAGEFDLAILDVSMPRLTGLQATAELRRRGLGLRVLILSVHDNERYFFEALRVGAAGYVLKSAANRDLVDACRAIPIILCSLVGGLVADVVDRRRLMMATQSVMLLFSANLALVTFRGLL